MSLSELHSGDDLLALRTHIGRMAIACGVDVSRDDNVGLLLAGDFSRCKRHGREEEVLRALLVLLYRLETSVSEDLGVDGLIGLWRTHNDILALHGFPAASQPALNGSTS